MTILQISILLHYWCTGGEDYINQEAPAVQEATAKFVIDGVLKETGNASGQKYEIDREMAKPYIDAVTSIPLPKKTFIIPKYKVKRY